VTEFLRDIRFGSRLLWKSPGFAVVSLLALALGIGATTAIFSLLYSVLLAPLPYPDSARLVMVWEHRKGERISVTTEDYQDWQRQSTVFQTLGAWGGEGFTLSTANWTEEVQATRSSTGFFDSLIGQNVHLGRHFIPDDAKVGNDRVVILNYSYWQQKFGSDPNVIGRKLRMSGELYTIIGVAAPGPNDRGDSQMNVPLAFRPDEINRRDHWLLVLGRLKPGITVEAANAEMAVVQKRLGKAYPETDADLTVSVEPLQNDFLPTNTRTGLWLMMGAVGFVLLIACVNIANLLLAWGLAREREIGIRVAHGASRGRIFRQFLAESLALASLGGALGVFCANGILKGVMAAMPRNDLGIPYEADPRLNVPVLLFTLGATLLSGVLFGSAPAWQAARQNIADVLKESGRSLTGGGHRLLRRVLVIAEFALAFILVAGAGLVVRSFINVATADLGVRTDHVLTFRVPLRLGRTLQTDQIRQFYRQLMERIEVVPGVRHAALSVFLPGGGGAGSLPFSVVGQPTVDVSKQPSAFYQPSTPGYYETYGIRLTKGRFLNGGDIAGGVRAAMVSESFARQYLAGMDPLAQRLRIPELLPGHNPPLGAPVEWQIVGVFHDVQFGARPTAGAPEVNVPFDQSPWSYTSIAVRTYGDPAAVTKSIAAAIHSMDQDLPMTGVLTLDQVVSQAVASDRFTVVVFGSFAGLALVLAAIGIYGVMTFSVAQRSHEMGIRMALGAGRAQVLRLVVSDGMKAALAGLALGIPGAWFVGRTLRGLLYNVGAFDGRSFAAVVATLLVAALLACYLPARRATRIDPMSALRDE
jgi:putative ABC transport system permease protein